MLIYICMYKCIYLYITVYLEKYTSELHMHTYKKEKILAKSSSKHL